MKKLIMLTAMFVVAALFVPVLYAADTANLEVNVTFDQPIRIWSEPAGNAPQDVVGLFEVIEGDTLMFQVIAEEKGNPDLYLEVIEQPYGSKFIPYEIDPNNPCRREGKFVYVPVYGVAQEEPYIAKFRAFNDKGEEAILIIKIRVIEAFIAIELNNSEWVIENIGLGETRKNLGADGIPLHTVKNVGNKFVVVDMGYGPYAQDMLPRPGFEQGLDTFITMIRELVIPPNEWMGVAKLPVGETKPVALTYGAPTALSGDVMGHGATYEFRACPIGDIEPLP